jgi:hypothetical protein
VAQVHAHAQEVVRGPGASGPWARPGVTVTELTQVPGWFARPDVPGPVPAVLLLHPAGAGDRRGTILARDANTDQDVYLFDDLAAALLTAGVAVTGFDSRFVTARRTDGWEPGQVTFPALIQDAAALLGFLRGHPGVDRRRISLLGISLGTQIAVGAAARTGGECRLILAAPGAVSLGQHLSWMLIGRRLEWLLAAGLVGRDATVDLGRLAGLAAERAGWWDAFDPADFTHGTGPVSYEQVAAVLHHQHDTFVRDLFATGDESSPAEYWLTRRAHPPMAQSLATLRGRVWLHVGDEDWTTPPRQAWLLAHSAPPGLDVQVTVHPDLGHLLSPRDRAGRLTFGPIHPSAVAALTASALDR